MRLKRPEPRQPRLHAQVCVLHARSARPARPARPTPHAPFVPRARSLPLHSRSRLPAGAR